MNLISIYERPMCIFFFIQIWVFKYKKDILRCDYIYTSGKETKLHIFLKNQKPYTLSLSLSLSRFPSPKPLFDSGLNNGDRFAGRWNCEESRTTGLHCGFTFRYSILVRVVYSTFVNVLFQTGGVLLQW